jgi:hypothetical protein
MLNAGAPGARFSSPIGASPAVIRMPSRSARKKPRQFLPGGAKLDDLWGRPSAQGSNQLLVKTCGAVTSGAFAATVLTSPNTSAIAKTTLKAVFMAPTPKS